ncbi:hypothetical protein [Hyphomicrobium sp.]|uniref:hypothetical protein n=1 Tax=Hyphomicrobium sp. TaxID=82 RepID=UPI002FDD759F
MSMDRIRTRELSSLAYGDPTGFLRELRNVEKNLGTVVDSLPDKARRLRTNTLKPSREMRDAALFCQGMSERLGHKVFFAPTEREDYDFVAMWCAEDEQRFCPVQLKELVPADCNPLGSLDSILSGLSRYGDARGLTVALRLNRTGRFDPAALKLPSGLRLGGLWTFGCVSADQSKWAIWGDFASRSVEPIGTEFEYPV